MKKLKYICLLLICLLLSACSANILANPQSTRQSITTSSTGASPTRSPVIPGTTPPSSVAVSCQPSPSAPYKQTGMHEIQGKAENGQLWLLVDGSYPIRVNQVEKLIWRMTGTGALQLTATYTADGSQVKPVDGPVEHTGSMWTEHPGDEWGTTYQFPKTGCWRIQATRGSITGSVQLLVVP